MGSDSDEGPPPGVQMEYANHVQLLSNMSSRSGIAEDEYGTMFEDMPGTWEDVELEPVLSWLHATVACNR